LFSATEDIELQSLRINRLQMIFPGALNLSFDELLQKIISGAIAALNGAHDRI
jgi:hypothetical protein